MSKHKHDYLDDPVQFGEAKAKTGEEIIKSGKQAECRICRDALDHKEKASNYCADCKNAFCKNHGNFKQGGRARCVICGVPKKYFKEPQGE